MRDADDREHSKLPQQQAGFRVLALPPSRDASSRGVRPASVRSLNSQPESRYSFAGAKKDGKKVVDRIDRAQYRTQSRAMHCRAMHCKVMDWAITAKGDRDAFGFDWCFDYRRHRRHLLLGDRQVCHGSPAGAAAQAARGPDLSRGDPATDSASARRLYLGAFACEPATPLGVADEVMEWNQLWRFRSPHHCGPRVRHADFRTKATLDQRFASVLS